MNWIGLDIGGANLKFAFLNSDDSAQIRSMEAPFPMWTDYLSLADTLRKTITNVDVPTGLAVTMTGELADCFASKKEGVNFIADAVIQAATELPDFNDDPPVWFYMTDGNWCGPSDVQANWQSIAAANWHATAKFCSRFLPKQTGLVIDVGSTTTDVTPVRSGRPAAIGKTDFQRLLHRELTYAGVVRTPICHLLPAVRLDDQTVPLSAEFFATIDDALLWLGHTAENATDNLTADHRPRTRDHAGQRLARMLCSDFAEVGSDTVHAIARQSEQRLQSIVGSAIAFVIERSNFDINNVIVVGEGDFLAEKVLKKSFPNIAVDKMSKRTNTNSSICGPAFSVAVLAAETITGETITDDTIAGE